MSTISNDVISNTLLPFLEHPQDDTSLREVCKKWRFLFPQAINLHMPNAIAASSLNFLIAKYENCLKEHGNRYCTIYSIKATLVRPLEYIPMNVCLSSLKKLHIQNGSWQSVEICNTTSLEELSMKGELDWSTLVRIKNFTNLHTLTLIQTADAPLIEDMDDLRNLQHLPLQKLRIGDSHLTLSHVSALAEFSQLKELILDPISLELFNSDAFRTKALEMDALKQINDQPDTLWRPLFAHVHEAAPIAQMQLPQNAMDPLDAPANEMPELIEAAPPPIPRRTCYYLFRLCEILYAAIQRFIRYFLGEGN